MINAKKSFVTSMSVIKQEKKTKRNRKTTTKKREEKNGQYKTREQKIIVLDSINNTISSAVNVTRVVWAIGMS